MDVKSGRPMPEIPQLHDLYHGYFRFNFRGGEVTMIAGQPGAQKSGFALWLVTEWAKQGKSALYVSADSAIHTVRARAAAAVTGQKYNSVMSSLSSASGYYAEETENLHIEFMFDSNPTFSDIEDRLSAWVEAWDSYPDILVIDNLLDVYAPGGENETSSYKGVLLDAKFLARQTEACVIILHHMKEGAYSPTWPAPRKGVMGMVSQTPENVFSVAIGEDRKSYIFSVVKHRSGPDDPTAQIVERLSIDMESNRFGKYVDIKAPMVTTWQERDSDDD